MEGRRSLYLVVEGSIILQRLQRLREKVSQFKKRVSLGPFGSVS